MRLKKTKKCGIYALCTVLVFSILFSGCGKKNAGETETGLFYLNQEKTRIVKEEYEPEAEDTGPEAVTGAGSGVLLPPVFWNLYSKSHLLFS